MIPLQQMTKKENIEGAILAEGTGDLELAYLALGTYVKNHPLDNGQKAK